MCQIYDMIKNLLSFIPLDKYEHFALAAIAAAAIKVVLLLLLPVWASMLVSFVVVILCAIGKEVIYDKSRGKGTPEWADLWAGVLGALVGVA